MEVAHTRSVSGMSQIEFWQTGVSAGMHLLPLENYIVDLLSFNLQGLRMLKFFGFANIHEEVLQQTLSLHQVVGIHFLMDHGYILSFTPGILKTVAMGSDIFYLKFERMSLNKSNSFSVP